MASLQRAVLFDLDGVQVKSAETWFMVPEEAGRRFRGRPVTREDFAPTFGHGIAANVRLFGLSCPTAELAPTQRRSPPRTSGATGSRGWPTR